MLKNNQDKKKVIPFFQAQIKLYIPQVSWLFFTLGILTQFLSYVKLFMIGERAAPSLKRFAVYFKLRW